MEKVYLRNISLYGVKYESLPIILDDDGNVLIVFLLFSIYLNNNYQTIAIKEPVNQMGSDKFFEHNPVSDSTINNYLSAILKFLRYSRDNLPSGLNIQQINRLKSKFVNNYLNSYIASNHSLNSLKTHRAALTAFFNFFTYLDLNSPLNLCIYQTARDRASINSNFSHIKYLSKEARFDLLMACKTKMHRLLMRTGYELGVRTSENRGFVLHNPAHKKGSLSVLFDKLNNNRYDYLHAFEYFLDGQYTKGNKSRILIIDRKLLSSLYEYYQTERMEILAGKESNTLFVLTSNAHRGAPISSGHATKIFKEYVRKIDYISDLHSYHDLRHTYATELYDFELTRGEVRSENAALIKTAQALGHSIHNGIPKSTLKYIHIREQMLEIEDRV